MANKEKSISAAIKARDLFSSTIGKAIKKTEELKRTFGSLSSSPVVIAAKDSASAIITKAKSNIEALKNSKVGSLIISAKDKASSIINRVKSKVTDKALTMAIVYLMAKDKASAVVNKVKGGIKSLSNTKLGQAIISARDKATATINKVSSSLKGITGKAYNATIGAKDRASSTLGGIKGKLAALAGGVTIAVAAKIGFEGLAAEQNQKITIDRVIQNSGKTKEQAKKSTEEYYKYLEDFANKTPFSTADVATMGTKSMMLAKGNVDYAKTVTSAMANTKAFVGDLRTSQEVAEAFFSAGNGNMDMLNNMLGEQYKTMDEALEGIAKKQGGLVDEMSNTVGGLWSTVMGKIQTGLKKINEQFQPMISGALDGVIKGIDIFLPKIIGAFGTMSSFMTDLMAGDSSKFPIIDSLIKAGNIIKTAILPIFSTLKTEFENVFKIMGEKFGNTGGIIESVAGTIATVIQNLQPIFSCLSPVFEFIANTAITVWPIIQSAIEIASKVIGDVVGALRPVLDAVNRVMSLIGETVAKVWPSVKETILNVWDNIKPALNLLKTVATTIADVFEKSWPLISGAVEKVWKIVSPIFEAMSKILGNIAGFCDKVISGVGNAAKKISESKLNPFNWFGGGGTSNAYGKRVVPYDGYQATLHQGERVLTKRESRQLDNSGGLGSDRISINIANMQIREEADINRIASELVKQLKEAKLAYGGEW